MQISFSVNISDRRKHEFHAVLGQSFAHLLPLGRQVCSDYGLHDSDACNLLT